MICQVGKDKKMTNTISEYVEALGLEMSDHARVTLNGLSVTTEVGQLLISLITNYRSRINCVWIEPDITTSERLKEVASKEGIEFRTRCLLPNESSNTLNICGLKPPAIEVIKETTSFRPASFRLLGYIGTDAWFAEYEQGNNMGGFHG
jgi:hypothetical protein